MLSVCRICCSLTALPETPSMPKATRDSLPCTTQPWQATRSVWRCWCAAVAADAIVQCGGRAPAVEVDGAPRPAIRASAAAAGCQSLCELSASHMCRRIDCASIFLAWRALWRSAKRSMRSETAPLSLSAPPRRPWPVDIGEARHPELYEGPNTPSTVLHIVRSAARAIGDISKQPRRRRHAATLEYRVPYKEII